MTIPTAEQLEEQLAFEGNKLIVARKILDVSYKLAEEGADEQQLLLLRRAASDTFEAQLWELAPAPKHCCTAMPIPWQSEDQPF